MTSKEEYGKLFNQILGVEVDWTKMSKEELASLATVFANPEIILNKLGLQGEFKAKAARDTMVDAGFQILKEWEGPFAKLARKFLGMETTKPAEPGKD